MTGIKLENKEWLIDLGGDLQRIGDEFSQVDDRGDFSVATFGDQRIVDALTKFTDNWRDGRTRITEGVTTLGAAITGAGHAYVAVDTLGPQTSSTPNGGDNSTQPSGTQTVISPTPNGPTTPTAPPPSSVTAPVDGPAPTPVPPTEPLPRYYPGPPPYDNTLPSPFFPVPRPGRPGVRDPSVPVTPWQPTTSAEIREQADRLRFVARDLDRQAADSDDPADRERLRAAADRLYVQADELDELARRVEADERMRIIECDPDGDGRITYTGPDDPENAVVVVCPPGSTGDFIEGGLGTTDQLVDQLDREGCGNTGVYTWQDYRCDGELASDQVVEQGAANLGAFIDQVGQQTGLPPENIAVIGDGTGGAVADRAAEAGALGGANTVTPSSLGLPEEPAMGPIDGPDIDGDKEIKRSNIGSPGLMMGVMAMGSMSQMLFRGRSADVANSASTPVAPDDRKQISAW